MSGAIMCPHGVPIAVCAHPMCQEVVQGYRAARSPRAAEPEPEPEPGETIEVEGKLPDWIDSLSFDEKRQVLTLRAKAVVRFGPQVRVTAFDYEMTLDHVDAIVDLLMKLRDRARQMAEVIDVPSSEPSTNGHSSRSS